MDLSHRLEKEELMLKNVFLLMKSKFYVFRVICAV